MLYKLEAMTVYGIFILLSSNIVDDNASGDVRASISVWFTDAPVSELELSL
jgi:hypothetical protein